MSSQTWRQIDAYAFSSTNIIGQWIFTQAGLWVGHYKISFFELYSDGQVQLNHSLTCTSSVHTYERRLIGYTQLTLFPSSELWSQSRTTFRVILLPRFKSRPACSARPIVLQIESSHRCINQHRPTKLPSMQFLAISFTRTPHHRETPAPVSGNRTGCEGN